MFLRQPLCFFFCFLFLQLICFKRGFENPVSTVHGCRGYAFDSHTNYCMDLRDLPPHTLAIVGDNGIPSAVYPLQRCQGDCDLDSDCAHGLKCFYRADATDRRSIAGCIGTLANTGSDYCY